MPSSRASTIPDAIERIQRINPQSLLDIGVGCGKYGLLAREYLEYWQGGKRQIDGIEAFEAYITDVQKAIYDSLYIGDARDILPSLGHYDLILLMDVIEHFTEDDAESMLRLCYQHASSILVSTPTYWSGQVAEFGNEYERHKSLLTGEWFTKRFDVTSSGGLQGIAVFEIRGTYV